MSAPPPSPPIIPLSSLTLNPSPLAPTSSDSHPPTPTSSTSSSQQNIPTKKILSPAHKEAFQASQTHRDIVEFIEELNGAVVGVKLGDVRVEDASPAINSLLSILTSILSTALFIPPKDNSASRFGNPAFKTFYDVVGEISPDLHRKYLPSLSSPSSASASPSASTPASTSSTSAPKQESPADPIPELCTYFNESWGNRGRIDYGSGMELNFLCWLLCLRKLGVLNKDDDKYVVLLVFWKYIAIMRHLQSTYWLEPAGSHGVWGLDDYHFLPFLWGAGQLANHKHFKPKAIHDQEILEEFSKDYMYLQCIQFINSIKTASLRWHSPMLDDISAVKTWSKVNEGMIKMYKAEVLGKLPVVQHFLFGPLLPFPEVEGLDNTADQMDEHGHVHGGGKGEAGWSMDCCGIPVPSAFGAAAAASGINQGAGNGLLQPRAGLRPIPFD